ncbi:MAG: leucyl aminopeptidase [Deltaproteobacteria bacterium]|nr:leucyl aminopeptidase [Deltaproteobacteria bacterium]
MTTSTFIISQKAYTPKKNDFLVLPFIDATTPAFDWAMLPRGLTKIAAPKKRGAFRLVQLHADSKLPYAVAVCRLDSRESDMLRQAKTMVTRAQKEADQIGMKRVVIPIDGNHSALCGAVQEGALLGGYIFDRYLSKKSKPMSVMLQSDIQKTKLHRGKVVAECVNFARDVLNEPPVEIHPESLADAFKTFGTEKGLNVEVWNEKKLARENCGGILAVGGGAASKPRLVWGTYTPENAAVHLALVGKGVTFDSGGYSLKPPKSMTEMKFDMGGAAMMFGAAAAIAALRLPIRVSVLTPLAHNAISRDAYNVSDVVTTRSGKSVEVQNTDAEGRIILADALTLACEQKPDYLIDSATLTGAAVVALGEDIAAVYGDDNAFVTRVLEAGKAVGEDLWPMPLHMAYDKQLDSPIADMQNIGGGWGGSITAALFLKRFIPTGSNWIHMDIAGPGCKIDALEHLGKGAKGFGVKTIVHLAEQLCEA